MANNTKNLVLYLCGSFNPITIAHLRMFELAKHYLQEVLHFNVLAGLISPVGDHYPKPDMLPADQRCQMVGLALSDTPPSERWIFQDCWEAHQPCFVRTNVLRARLQEELSRVQECAHHSHNTPANSSVPVGPDDWQGHVLAAYRCSLQSSVGGCPPQKVSSCPPEKIQLHMLAGSDILNSFAVPGLWSESDIGDLLTNDGLVVVDRPAFPASQLIYNCKLLHSLRANIHVVTDWLPNEISSTHVRKAVERGENVRYVVSDSVERFIRENSLYRNLTAASSGPLRDPVLEGIAQQLWNTADNEVNSQPLVEISDQLPQGCPEKKSRKRSHEDRL